MQITISCKKVANTLKLLVNNMCEEGFLWYPEADKTKTDVTTYDLANAISVLESIEDKVITIQEEN